MVMSTGFINALRKEYPASNIDVIVKKGLEPLTDFIPVINSRYVFDRNEYKGLGGAYRFGRSIRKEKKYDLFFCLPDSFSSAVMGWATGAKQRIGFRKELRSVFLTCSFNRPEKIHRVEEYVSLLTLFTGKPSSTAVGLERETVVQESRFILNFNSEAVSRRMPVAKGAAILKELIRTYPGDEVVCIGGVKEKLHIDSIIEEAGRPTQVVNMAGQTKNVGELARLIATGKAMLTTDSGPAHVANALGIPSVVLFGAGNENNTSPYNKDGVSVIRLGKLPCEPCVKNRCIYGLPKCLELLDEQVIIKTLGKYL